MIAHLSKLGLHIISNPAGSFSFVGNVPIALHDLKPAKASDIMGGRSFKSRDGSIVTYKTRTYASVDSALNDAKSVGASLCDNEQCACRKLF